MQKVVEFRGSNIADQLSDYLNDNSGEEFVSVFALRNKGDETVIAIVDDGQ